MRILIQGGVTLTLDGEHRVLEGHDVLVEDGRISQIGAGLANTVSGHVDKVIEASRHLVLPGLVNAHLHSYDGYMKGLYEGYPLEVLLPYLSLASRRPLTERELYVRTLLAATEMIRSGVTTGYDDVTFGPLSREAIDSVMRAYRDSGIRAVVAAHVVNRPLSATTPYMEDVFPPAIRQKADAAEILPDAELLALCRWMIKKWNGVEQHVHVALAPSAPQRCSDEFLLEMDRLSDEAAVPWNTHVLETKVQVVTGTEFYGRSIVEHLADLGVLSARLALNHGVWLTDRDIELLAKAGTSVVHNPICNAKAGSGIAPIRAMLGAGVNVALGCDNVGAVGAQNMFEAMKLAALLPQVAGPRFGTWEPACEVLRMATEGGAKTVLLQDEIGSLQVGRRADIIMLDLGSHAFTPLNDPVRQLVYSEKGTSVDTVLVQGAVVMENRQILTVDEPAILQEAREIGLSLRREHVLADEMADEFRPYLEKVYWLSANQDVGFSRYTGGC